ncbi:methionine ABC transporter ATP-binding protein [Virgibacillus sp. W0181]|uniref:methionine ABC transporter ATP-binding protein n=1 Tax=Virgibacillus sp. W0181 TaxID=3391581 RepID=UPI003F46CF71
MIVLDHVSKFFSSKSGDIKAVTNVSLHVKQGEIHGVIGYSGAGKSTLIRCVNLLEQPTSGNVFIQGKESTFLSPDKLRSVRKNIGMIFQGFNLLKTASVYDNIAIPLKLLGLKKEDVHKRVEKYLDIVDLADKKNAYPNQLSGGQKQRVAIARALAQEPDILLSDEATSALDPETTDAILDLLLKINEEFGITILLITHEMNVIQKICDNVTVLEKGEVIEQGTAVQLFASPKNKTTQKFLNTISQRKLSSSLISQLNLNGTVVRLTFIGENTGEPLLAQLTKKFDVQPNILTANIIELKNDIIGNLVIHLTGDQEIIEQALQFLRKQNVGIERLEGN